MNPLSVLSRAALAVFLAAALPSAQAANVVVTPGGVAGYMYLTPPASGGGGTSGTEAGDVDCSVAFVSTYTKTFAAGEVTQDLAINYWMKGGGGGGSYREGGNGAAVSSRFTIPSGYVGPLAIWVGRGGGAGKSYSAYTSGGRGGDGYAAGGGGGLGTLNCTNCVMAAYGGGGGGASAITLGGTPKAIAGGGGGAGGLSGGNGGNGVGASGGGGGGRTPGSSGSDTKGGIWNDVPPASSGGSGSTTMYTTALPYSYSACEADLLSEQGGGGFGGVNGGGGGGGGGGHITWATSTYNCAYSLSGGGGGGGGAGGGGGGGGGDNVYNGRGFETFAQLTGAAGGAYGAAGLAAPDTTASVTTHAGGLGGSFNSTAGGTLPGNSHNPTALSTTQGDLGTYQTDPYVFLQDKGFGGAGAHYNGTIVVQPSAGASGGVFLKYAAPTCIIQPPI